MKRTVVARLDLGRTRIARYLLYSPNNENDFEEVTPKETLRLVQEGMVNGLKIVEDELIPDVEGFNQLNIKIKSGVGRYRNMIETGKQSNTNYSVVRKTLHDSEEVYHLITSKCGRFDCDAENLKMLFNFADVAGVRLNENGNIEVCDGVEVLDYRFTQGIEHSNLDQIVDVGGKLMKISELDDLTADDLKKDNTIGLEAKTANSLEGLRSSESENEKTDNTECLTPSTANKKLKNACKGKPKIN